MKFSIVTLALASVAYASSEYVAAASDAEMTEFLQNNATPGLDIGKLLGGLKPLLKKAKCVAPAIIKSANGLKCDGKGPLDTLCGNIETIAKESERDIKKCGIENSTVGTVTKVLKDLCEKGKKF
ncbi:hypothetical protein HRG_001897 [Hirsutella rhossiliensis]|uniref:Hydrophobin n=1 Tax=Hirsutella rhossiliensis TaxID=111463 RepID=A0A9P8N1J1_9HYPO|nr:uncharacterized protein HRG_01897 [Hirsutella rhossiliensis]KAH0966488.1 hypothetical protein HRG_01897 [Hirsutella rhossiliensis]